LCEAVERAVRAGLVVVAAAGNHGKAADGRMVMGGITTPANSPYAIAVGAIDTHDTAQRSDDTLAAYSSKGPTRYDLVLKPDLAAPGSHIKSAEAADSYLSKNYPQRHVSGAGANGVMQLSGTSMAAGFVSGAAALVLDAREELTPQDAKTALQVTSTFLSSAGVLGAGAGMINALAAVELAATNQIPKSTTIAGEDAVTSRLFSALVSSRKLASLLRNSARPASNRLPDGTTDGDLIMWGSSNLDSIVWGIEAASIVWGIDANSIVWGVSANGIF
jgi:serine protease AprX